jgi:COP9 signalosome complex subunit 7
MEQTKALNALEPFLALSKSATSPRAAADLITRATSAPNTFIFTELLETPQIQALASSDEFAPYLTLIRIFSYGTYASLSEASNLPTLNDAQKLKLRQLSLLSLARDANIHPNQPGDSAPVLGYASLLARLDLGSPRELEELVISTIYAGLIDAKLDPKNELVRTNRVAALRDVAPGSASEDSAIGGLLSSLQAFAGRCEATMHSLEAQMSELRADADKRAAQATAWSGKMEKLVEDEQKSGKASGDAQGRKGSTLTQGTGINRFASAAGGGPRGQGSSAAAAAGSSSATAAGLTNVTRQSGKRGAGTLDTSGDSSKEDGAMDLDDEQESLDGMKRAIKRQLQS